MKFNMSSVHLLIQHCVRTIARKAPGNGQGSTMYACLSMIILHFYLNLSKVLKANCLANCFSTVAHGMEQNLPVLYYNFKFHTTTPS